MVNNIENEEIAETEDIILPEKGMKKKIILYLLPAIIIIGIVVGLIVTYFTKVSTNNNSDYDIVSQKNADGSGVTSTVFYTLPEISAKLRTSSGIFETVRIKINLELSSVNDISTISALMPRINDIILGHLVEITSEEISGSEGFYALKTELLHRINLMVSPIKILNLNIKDLNIQITDALDKQED